MIVNNFTQCLKITKMVVVKNVKETFHQVIPVMYIVSAVILEYQMIHVKIIQIQNVIGVIMNQDHHVLP